MNDVVRERIEQARIRAEREKRRRAELAEARRRGLPYRHAAKLRRLADALNNQTISASGT